jgi:hypothetical protein
MDPIIYKHLEITAATLASVKIRLRDIKTNLRKTARMGINELKSGL